MRMKTNPLMQTRERSYRYGIVVAGGKGLRMGGGLPKQFLSLGGKPILLHTLERMQQHCDELILVLPLEQQSLWQELCRRYQCSTSHRVCTGGASRFASVRNGLRLVEREDSLVAIHDGVRPLVSGEVIELCFAEAEHSGAALPYLPMVDSLRRLQGESSEAVDRSQYVSVQTPQTFRSGLILSAYSVEEVESFTDDASVFEAYHALPISLVRGNEENIKITTPRDMILAEGLLALRAQG